MAIMYFKKPVFDWKKERKKWEEFDTKDKRFESLKEYLVEDANLVDWDPQIVVSELVKAREDLETANSKMEKLQKKVADLQTEVDTQKDTIIELKTVIKQQEEIINGSGKSSQ